jgi:tRNA uridine 5-carboxymethylaminomethyl modification enzyme
MLLLSGMKRFPAGRLNDAPSLGLSASLAAAGFKLGRLQTGTPARLDGNTINFRGMAKQEGDETPLPFSYLNRQVDNAVGLLSHLLVFGLKYRLQANQVVCYQTVTTPATHQIVRDNLHLSLHIQETKKGSFFVVSSISHHSVASRSPLLSIARG